MEKRKIILFDILLGLFFFYTAYYFIKYEFFEYSRSLGETVMKRSFKNPLTVIFIGGQYGEGGSYRIFDIMTRFMTFFKMFISVILILGIFQYYKSKRKKVSILLFRLMISFWACLSALILMPLNKWWLRNHQSEMSSYKVELQSNYDLLITYANIIILPIVLFILIKWLIESQKTTEVLSINKYPLKWMRGFHSISDRIVMIFMGSNTLLWLYFNNRRNSNADLAVWQESMQETGLAFLVISLIFSYLISEWLFQKSPAKVLTGTKVISTSSDDGKINFMQSFARAIIRSIPFEFLSFFSQTGFHDRFSGTQLAYVQAENWMLRQIRIIKIAANFYTVVAIWFILAILVQVNISDSFISSMTDLPQLLSVLLLPLMAFLIVVWVSTVASYAQTIAYGEICEHSRDFLNISFWWFPVLHFFLPSKYLGYIYEDFKNAKENNVNISEDSLAELQSTSKSFSKGFIISFTLIILGILMYYAAGRLYERMAANICFAIATIYLCNVVVKYANTIKKLATEIENSKITETPLSDNHFQELKDMAI